ncbi:hypothetical protein CR194_04115 [Salipaludibacillus keqinensis]|uniref:Uncharacterized protein n=2 Tax=Salipaludibacillus keqinensis TaxID=2045207 RepID=A0A323TYS0_9BACI|nr:hypothetical protein CR194_04115 [Salipaludibacillus keqinensis]
MKIKILSFLGLLIVAVVAYNFVSNDDNSASEEVETNDIKELVHDYSVGNIENQVASITSHQLIVTDTDESEQTYDLPEDDFFVSIAPYENETHP